MKKNTKNAVKLPELAKTKPENWSGDIIYADANGGLITLWVEGVHNVARIGKIMPSGASVVPDGVYFPEDKAPLKLGAYSDVKVVDDYLIIGGYTFKRDERYQAENRITGEVFKIDATAIRRVAYATDQDGNRPVLACVYCKPGLAVAADGYRMHKTVARHEFTGLIYAKFAEYADSSIDVVKIERTVMIPTVVKERVGSRVEYNPGVVTEMINRIFSGEYMLDTIVTDMKYPDVDSLIPRSSTESYQFSENMVTWIGRLSDGLCWRVSKTGEQMEIHYSGEADYAYVYGRVIDFPVPNMGVNPKFLVDALVFSKNMLMNTHTNPVMFSDTIDTIVIMPMW